jgi:hypothetical protein
VRYILAKNLPTFYLSPETVGGWVKRQQTNPVQEISRQCSIQAATWLLLPVFKPGFWEQEAEQELAGSHPS